MGGTVETQLDAVVDQALGPHPGAGTRGIEQIGRRGLEHSRIRAVSVSTYSRLRCSTTTDSMPAR